MSEGRNLLTLRVITPEGVIFEQSDLRSVNIPLSNGKPIGVRPGHAPLIAVTGKGALVFRNWDNNSEINLYAGVLEIRNNVITVLTSGEVTENDQPFIEPSNMKYDRLMKTLVKQISSEPGSNKNGEDEN